MNYRTQLKKLKSNVLLVYHSYAVLMPHISATLHDIVTLAACHRNVTNVALVIRPPAASRVTGPGTNGPGVEVRRDLAAAINK